MGWQEELSALDEALAAGRITADQHRSRRDELLAAASGGGPAPARWRASQPVDPETTNVIRTSDFADPEKTQQVRPVGFPPPAPNSASTSQPLPVFPPQQQFGQPQRPVPPWEDKGFGVTPSTAAVHGSEVFDSGAGKSPRVGIYVLIGVLAFIVIGGGVFWFGLSGGMGTDSAAPPPPPTTAALTSAPDSSAPPTTTTPPSGLAAVPDPPGSPYPKNGEYTLAAADEAKIIPAGDLEALQKAGVEKVFEKSSGDGDLAYAIAVYVAKDEESAKVLSAALVENRAVPGTSTVELNDVPKSVAMTKLATSNQFLYRGIYTSGKMTVRVATAGPTTVADQDVGAKFTDFMRKVIGSIRVG
ncbi:hypothetical protein ACFFQW_24185 [Umezawaea endophytica]|uniref:Flagellar basal body-associated protein FliL n=1 Tax=Umezawaea endophytica TaxID=1654476 RepID=A0A9X2VV11_9PSEU|nr:hypothetical protein [Umezawaea endophytica]MCS7482123.1 hypothetical protein [Umezawaea endophytica]